MMATIGRNCPGPVRKVVRASPEGAAAATRKRGMKAVIEGSGRSRGVGATGAQRVPALEAGGSYAFARPFAMRAGRLWRGAMDDAKAAALTRIAEALER